MKTTTAPLRIVDLLTALLTAHAETLVRLSALLGEEELLGLLDEFEDPVPEDGLKVSLEWNEGSVEVLPRGETLPHSPYALLEGTVRELGLPAFLEFYLWAFPPYRFFVEGSTPLDARFTEAGAASLDRLTRALMEDGLQWVRNLRVPSSVSRELEQSQKSPWLKFRSSVMDRAGARRLKAL